MPIVKIGSLELLQLSGDPNEMGEEHGRVLKHRIHDIVENYVDRSEEHYDVPASVLVSEARRSLPFIPMPYIEELEALSFSSEVPFEKLLALNCLSDIDACYTQHHLHCCNFILGPPATSDGLFVHGRNLDFPPAKGAIARGAILISRTPCSGAIPTLSVGFAGFVGTFTGYSKERLTAAEVGVASKSPSIEGIPISIHLRHCLEHAALIDDVFRILSSHPRTGGYNLAISDGKNSSCMGIETTRNLCEKRGPRKGVLVVDDVCLCRTTGKDRLVHASGAFRYARMMQLIQQNIDAIELDTAFGFLADNYDMAIARKSGKSYNCIANMHTVQSVLFLPSQGKLYVSHGVIPAPSGSYTELNDTVIFA